jgi:hypothetical protein
VNSLGRATWIMPNLPETVNVVWYPITDYVYARGGKVIARLVTTQLSVLNAINDPVDLEIYLDRDAKATGQMYLDEWDGFKPGSLLLFGYSEDQLWVKCGEVDVILNINRVVVKSEEIE